MAILSLIEAALRLGLRVETLEYLTENCPKRGESRKLLTIKTEQGPMFDEDELLSYSEYLSKPWPKPKDSSRPTIPKIFKDDVKDESHHACAICGYMDNGEIAHIDAVSETLNNSPSNLIYLCPNHHTKYDYGFKPSSNVTETEIRAAKTIKKNSRCRVMKYESFATRNIISLVNHLKSLQNKIDSATSENMKSILISEAGSLISAVPDIVKESQKQAKKDSKHTEVESAINRIAPNLSKIASRANDEKKSSKDTRVGDELLIRKKVSEIISEVDDVLIEIDEVNCPHCDGRGLTGLIGDFCRYCRGSCVVSQEKYDAYDRDEVDELECPHCNGAGTTGLVGDFCNYCRGSCVVSQEKYDAYDRDEVDEVECPHCNGAGTTGLVGDFCKICKGSCTVTEKVLRAYEKRFRR